MRKWTLVVVPVMIAAAGCNRGDDRAAADSALTNDLNLASQVGPYQPIDSMEAGLAATGAAAPAAAAAASRTSSRASTTRSTATRRTVSRSASSGGTVRTSSGGEVVVKKNTKRDAIIGAAAGAAIGAATSKDKLKGAVIGGAIGGVIGGVIGNNVDVQKTRRPPQD